MKTLIVIFLVISSLSVFAQLPEPKDFDFSYDYIMIDEAGYCAGQWVYGPTYCSHFTWSSPDTNTTNSTLEYYNLYYYSYDTYDTIILTTTTNLYVDIQIGIIGEIWVTGVYSDPDGESGPSNTVINEDLPISVNEILQDDLRILYDNINKELLIDKVESVSKLNIYNCQGEMIYSEKPTSNKINIESYSTGLYIIEIINNDQEVIRRKIII